MAKVRIGFSTQFEVENEKVGIGTDSALETLHATGDIIAHNIDVSAGITTVTTYSGFIDKKVKSTNPDVNLNFQSHALSDEIIIEEDVTVSSGTTFTSGPENLTVTDNFTLPGVSDDKPTVGTLRFNENLASLEFYTGVEWRAVNSYVDMGNRSRGVCSGGWNPANSVVNSTMDVFSLTSQGNAIDFGTLAQSQNQAGSVSNSIRGIVAGGGPGNDTHMEYYTITSGGTGIDFGNLNTGRRRPGGLGSSTRGLICGGRAPGAISAIDYMEIMTLGAAPEFGDLTTGKNGPSTVSSPTHGIITNGYGQSSIDKVTIASKGNAVDVGDDLFYGGYATGGASTGTRGVWGGGYTSAAVSPYSGMSTTSVRGVDIASGGNSTEFGNLIYSQYATYICGTGSHTRGFWMGGAAEPLAAALYSPPHIVMMNLKSGGEAENWGDLPIGRSGCTAFSDCHGGLGGI